MKTPARRPQTGGTRTSRSATRRGSGAPGPRPEARQLVALRAGQKLTLSFRSLNLEGAGVAVAGPLRVAVPFALPGEEAIVEITRGGRRPEGKIVSLVRKSAHAAIPQCRHFGVCGGCQWQHLSYDAQLEHKTRLVRAHLEDVLQGAGGVVREAVGAAPWEYRNRVQAAFALRRDKVVVGYHTLGGDLRVINVQECPIQHGDNVHLLRAARDAVTELGWPIYDHDTGRGLVRGVIGQVGMHSGEAMLVLCTGSEVPDRMALVRAVRDRVLNLTSLLLSVQPAHTSELLGSIRLLWGRAYIEDEIARLQLRLYATPAVPPNPRALPLWLEAISRGIAPDGTQTVADAACEEGLVPLALASRVARVIGIAPDREAMHRAWENARLNGITNCVFYTRAPAGVLVKLRARGERIDAIVVSPRGRPTAAEVFQEAAASGARRVVCAAHSLTLLAQDVMAAQAAGFRPIEIQPVDLLPQTSRIHCVVAMERQA